MFDGQYATAMQYARKAESMLPAGDKDSGVQFLLAGIIPMGATFLESYLSLVWHVMIRFGKWDDIIAEPMRTDTAVFAGTCATQHYARGVAYASKGMVAEAQAEKALFDEALTNPALAGRVLHNNKVYQDGADGPSVLAVSAEILQGEIDYRIAFLAKAAGEPADFSSAFQHLRRGVDLSLGLAYNEPWGQMQVNDLTCAACLCRWHRPFCMWLTVASFRCSLSATFSARSCSSRESWKRRQRSTAPTSSCGRVSSDRTAFRCVSTTQCQPHHSGSHGGRCDCRQHVGAARAEALP